VVNDAILHHEIDSCVAAMSASGSPVFATISASLPDESDQRPSRPSNSAATLVADSEALARLQRIAERRLGGGYLRSCVKNPGSTEGFLVPTVPKHRHPKAYNFRYRLMQLEILEEPDVAIDVSLVKR
jgi:hypothetical protein